MVPKLAPGRWTSNRPTTDRTRTAHGGWALLGTLALWTLGCAGGAAVPSSGVGGSGLEVPPTRRVAQVDVYHGVKVPDPYRWLEEPSQERSEWIEAQQRLLESFVATVPKREELERRLLAIRRYDSVGTPQTRGEELFYVETPAGEVHGSLYVRRGFDGPPRAVLDFGQLIREEGHTLGGFTVSEDGRYVAWASLSQAGWGFLEVADVAGGKVRPERIAGVGGASAIWTHDHRGFFYVSFGEYEALEAGTVEPRPTILYHRLGTDPSQDEVIYSRSDRPAMLFTPKLSDDGRYLVVGLNDGDRSRNTVVVKDLRTDTGFVPLIEPADASFVFEGNVGSRFFFQTTFGAPRGRVVAFDLEQPGRDRWQEVIPEREAPLGSVSHVGGRWVVSSTVHARPVVEIWSHEGRLDSTLDLPSIGLLGGLADDPAGRFTYYRINNLFDPGSVYRIDVEDRSVALHHRPKMAFDPEAFELRQVFYEGADGTRIPMFLAYRKDLPLAGDRPLFMYGYGHGGWVGFPWFQPHLVVWLEMGGTYALPGLRGGGEYGLEWQEAGTPLNKPRTVSDYVAAAEWLIGKGYTSPGKLVANGGSASGVLPAAAAVARPELFAAALIDFPFLDMFRYHLFTSVKGWTRGYGSSEVAEEFEVLRSYSPLHNLEAGRCYPPMLTVVGEEDQLTLPFHGYKFTAALQAAQGCPHPALVKLVAGGGHYVYGTTPEAAARTESEILAFLLASLSWEGEGGRM
ncbi:MAG: S9 family peptidase [Acidobacteria bacterium]|nr:S9 family peptidase [Acidobacteriota bacterium]